LEAWTSPQILRHFCGDGSWPLIRWHALLQWAARQPTDVLPMFLAQLQAQDDGWVDAPMLVMLLTRIAWHLMELSLFHTGDVLIRRAFDLWEQHALGDRDLLDDLLNVAGRLALRDGRFGEALGYFERQVALLGGPAHAIAELAEAAELGDLADLGKPARLAELARLAKLGCAGANAGPADLGIVYANMGFTLMRERRLAEGVAAYERALEMYDAEAAVRETDDQSLGYQKVYGNMGQVYHMMGNGVLAMACLSRAILIEHRLHDGRETAGCLWTLQHMGLVYRRRVDDDAGLALLSQQEVGHLLAISCRLIVRALAMAVDLHGRHHRQTLGLLHTAYEVICACTDDGCVVADPEAPRSGNLVHVRRVPMPWHLALTVHRALTAPPHSLPLENVYAAAVLWASGDLDANIEEPMDRFWTALTRHGLGDFVKVVEAAIAW
jgi:tetratricopeptide (TPR) repeat protein